MSTEGDEFKWDIDEEHDSEAAAAALRVEGVEPAGDVSKTVLELDRWSRRRGNELSKEWAELPVDEGQPKPAPYEPNMVADAHGSLFEPEPRLAERPADKARAAWWRQLMETPEYQALHQQTCLDSPMAEIGAKSIVDQWSAYAAEHQPKDGDPEPGSEGESIGESLARMRSTAKALTEASKGVESARDAVAGLGLGEEGGQIDAKQLHEYYKLVRNDEFLQKVMAMAGRMRSLCRSLQKQKVNAERGEITGIELSGDVGRLVPMEQALVAGAMPELEQLALYRLALRRSLSYKMRKVEHVQPGPLVVVVDESGSMGGEKIIAAKALALALGWLARKQKRWMAYVGFAGGTKGTRLAMPPNKSQPPELIEWLKHMYGGGTKLDVPLQTLPTTYWNEFIAQGLTRGRTDVVFITDALVETTQEVIDDYKRWAKAESVRSYGIIIGEREAGQLAQVCQKYWCIPQLALDSEAVAGVLSI